MGSPSSVGAVARVVLLLSIGWGMASLMHLNTAALKSIEGGHLSDIRDDFNEGRPQESRQNAQAISKLGEQIGDLISDKNKLLEKVETGMQQLASRIDSVESKSVSQNQADETGGGEFEKLNNEVEKAKEKLEKLEDQAQQSAKEMADLVDLISGLRAKGTGASPTRQLKVHIWDDSTDYAPREDILVKEGWTEYNGKALGDPDDLSTDPMFELTDDPGEADVIVWASVMARHELEVPPVNPVKHAHKVLLLDYADGATIHQKLRTMREHHTELGYFKRSFIRHGETNSYNGNVTDGNSGIFPHAYSGCKAMMIAPGIPEADPNHEAILRDSGAVYGKVTKMSTSENNKDDGYFKDPRYQNFLVPYRDRKWNLVNVLRYWPNGPNVARNNVVEWTREFSQNMAGDPITGKDYMSEIKSAPSEATANDAFTSYVGEIDNFCSGHCFGPNYFRLLRDSKIVVTCNPGNWEGDFRLWEAFLSGALVFVDKMFILDFMPNPPIDGKHWVTYDPGNKTDFMTKITYYSDPANIDEAEAIAKRGYEFVLRHHMTVNRVEYYLNHEAVRNGLMEHIQDPSKRAILGYPPL